MLITVALLFIAWLGLRFYINRKPKPKRPRSSADTSKAKSMPSTLDQYGSVEDTTASNFASSVFDDDEDYHGHSNNRYDGEHEG